jgi:TolB-like protein/DNA-binding winged helix-turn-helix (wHTH) protein
MTGELRFGTFRLDAAAGALSKAGRPVRLRPQPVRVLAYLASRPGQLVTREELQRELWGEGTHVDFDQGLNSCIRQVRAALGDDADTPRYIETVPRRGYRFLAEVKTADEPEPAAPPPITALRRRFLIGVGAATLGGLAALGLVYAVRPAPPSPATALRIVVLPFENFGGDPAQEYLSDGLTEEMIAALGELDMAVIARTTAMRYKGTEKPIDQIGRELRVAYVLEGSVRQAGDRLRISVQLVQASDQARRWSGLYERDARDVLAVQAEVAAAVAQEIRLRLSPRQRERLARAAPVDPEAYAEYLRGRQAWNRRSAAGLREAIARFEAALARQPDYAPAHAGLADALSLMSLYADAPPRETFPRAREAADRALAIDPALAEAHTAYAYVAHRFDWDWRKAEDHYRQALVLNPSYATAHHWYAELLVVLGRPAEARREMRSAFELDPLSPRINLDLALPDYFAGRYDVAAARARKVLQMEPGFEAAQTALRAAYEAQGALADAARGDPELEQAWRKDGPPGYWAIRLARLRARASPRPSPAHVANLHALAGQPNAALEWLEKAHAQRDDELVWVAVEPAYASLRGDPRFVALLRRMGLAHVRLAAASPPG